ncbi:hypothetical protein [Duganella vulcania]|uniref:ArnR1-like winged helix-turn-helix domain-containing protein n=1 Tax=Duganella vulcania TaxID=2692166 RepID=A0A845GGE5_9BURK|nr:hypothetical protein [Duganella vulcania]MYM92482.1 hypothetical protein [Duganella vulcania]
MNAQAILLLQKIGLGVLEAVEVGGDTGAAGGVLYAAMMAHGASLSQFQSFMDTLLQRGFVTRSEDCYHITAAGQVYKAQLQAKFGAPRSTAQASA